MQSAEKEHSPSVMPQRSMRSRKKTAPPRRPESSGIFPRVAGVVLFGVAGLFLLAFLYTSLHRVWYPFDLEWMEGGSLDHVRHLLRGESMYVKPSIDFVPYIYAPGYYFVSAAFAKILGPGLPALRLVSFLSILGCLWLIGLIVKRETQSLAAGFLAAAVFSAGYGLVDGWYDLARVDSLLLLLLLGAVYCLRFKDSWWGALIGALLLFAAFFTKQGMVMFMLPLLLYYAWQKRLRGVIVLAIFGVLSLAGVLIGNALTSGWYQYYLFILPVQHAWVPTTIDFWINDLFKPWGVALIVSGLFLLLTLSGRRKAERDEAGRKWHEIARWYGILGIGLIGGSWLARLHMGGAINGGIPAFAWLAICAGLSFVYFLERSAQSSRKTAWQLAVYAVGLLQFGLLYYNPVKYIPTRADVRAGEWLCRVIARIPGEVYVPRHPTFNFLTGKRAFAHDMAIYDILKGTEQEKKDSLVQSILHAFDNRRFDAIIIDDSEGADRFVKLNYPTDYIFAGRLFGSNTTALNTRAGAPKRPELLFVRKGLSLSFPDTP